MQKKRAECHDLLTGSRAVLLQLESQLETIEMKFKDEGLDFLNFSETMPDGTANESKGEEAEELDLTDSGREDDFDFYEAIVPDRTVNV